MLNYQQVIKKLSSLLGLCMHKWTLTLAFCRTFPLLDALVDMGRFFSAVAELMGESPLLVVLMGVVGAGLDTGAILG